MAQRPDRSGNRLHGGSTAVGCELLPAARVFQPAFRKVAIVTRPAPYRTSPTNAGIGEIHTDPSRVADMPYAPAIRVEAPGDLLFISGATPSPLYHKHPHDWSEHDHPNDIREQTRRAMRTIQSILEHEGLTWTDVVKITKFLTDMREIEVMTATLKEFLGDWSPASTTICVNQLSTPGARIEIEVMAVYPKQG